MRIYVKHLMNRCSLSFVVIHARLRYYFALERLQRTRSWRVLNHCCASNICMNFYNLSDLSRGFLSEQYAHYSHNSTTFLLRALTNILLLQRQLNPEQLISNWNIYLFSYHFELHCWNVIVYHTVESKVLAKS